jgi:hypothetical protein
MIIWISLVSLFCAIFSIMFHVLRSMLFMLLLENLDPDKAHFGGALGSVMGAKSIPTFNVKWVLSILIHLSLYVYISAFTVRLLLLRCASSGAQHVSSTFAPSTLRQAYIEQAPGTGPRRYNPKLIAKWILCSISFQFLRFA